MPRPGSTARLPLLCDDDMLLALIPPFGPHAALTATRAVLKLATGRELAVEGSALTFLDAGGDEVGRLDDAFGLTPGTRLAGPVCRDLKDPRPRPADAVRMRWSVAGRHLAAPTGDPPEGGERLRAYFLPLRVAAPDDVHVVARYVHAGPSEASTVEAVRGAVLRVDGRAYESATGWHWDGPSVVRPGGTFGHRFALGDFPGAPGEGEHAVSLEMFGLETPPVTVRWRGEPPAGSPEP